MTELEKTPFDKGFEAFNNHLPKKTNPYVLGTKEHEDFLKGYYHGMEIDIIRFKLATGRKI